MGSSCLSPFSPQRTLPGLTSFFLFLQVHAWVFTSSERSNNWALRYPVWAECQVCTPKSSYLAPAWLKCLPGDSPHPPELPYGTSSQLLKTKPQLMGDSQPWGLESLGESLARHRKSHCGPHHLSFLSGKWGQAQGILSHPPVTC